MKNYSITTFLLSDLLSKEPYYENCKVLFERSGYMIIHESLKNNNDFHLLPKGKFYPFDNYSNMIFCLDTIPWQKENKNKKIRKVDLEKKISDNLRTSWAITAVIYFLSEKKELQILYEEKEILKYIYPIWDTEESIKYLKSNIPEFNAFNLKIEKTISSFKFPYQVVKDLTDYGCNNKIAIVEKGNTKYICKVFKENKKHYLNNELKILNQFSSDSFVPELIEKGCNYILIEYYNDFTRVHDHLNNLGLLSVKTSKKIFSYLKKLFDNGFIHMDFHPGNILFVENQIKFIDFEYLYESKNIKPKLEYSPGLVKSDRLEYDSPLYYITYENFWEKLIGHDLATIINARVLKLYFLRLPIYLKFYLSKSLRITKGKVKLLKKYLNFQFCL